MRVLAPVSGAPPDPAPLSALREASPAVASLASFPVRPEAAPFDDFFPSATNNFAPDVGSPPSSPTANARSEAKLAVDRRLSSSPSPHAT